MDYLQFVREFYSTMFILSCFRIADLSSHIVKVIRAGECNLKPECREGYEYKEILRESCL
jgi:hypothetical protein